MINDRDTLARLLQQYFDNRLTPAEYKELWRLLDEYPDAEVLDNELNNLWQVAKFDQSLIPDADWDEKMQSGQEKLSSVPGVTKKPRFSIIALRRNWIAAAAVILLVSTVTLFFLNDSKKEKPSADVARHKDSEDKLPGGDRAILTLSDGTTIVLDSAGNGKLAQQGKTSIIKKNDGQLVYNSASAQSNEVIYNLLQTPRGGQYQITLPDGSKVWLNAVSSLKYPVAFAGNERRVEITGEAYFEIAKDPSRPFKVRLNNMEVEVLGTHFNINGYADENVVKTTLLEGKVKIISSGVAEALTPGQQAQFHPSGSIHVINKVNLDEVVAWKEGNFQFDNSDIKTVMRQLARWYDVEVSYQGIINKHFVGNISRDVKLSQVLLMLEQTGEVRFKIENNKLLVMP
jgi:transmembrane sensor